AARHAVDHHARRAATLRVAGWRGHRDDVGRRRRRFAGVDALRLGVDRGFCELVLRDFGFVAAVAVPRDLERRVLPHVLERRESLARCCLGQTGDGVLEDPAIVFADLELLARAIGRLEVFANAHRAVGVDAPRQLDPELVLLPNLAGIRVARVVDLFARTLGGDAVDRLAEADPAARMRLEAGE